MHLFHVWTGYGNVENIGILFWAHFAQFLRYSSSNYELEIEYSAQFDSNALFKDDIFTENYNINVFVFRRGISKTLRSVNITAGQYRNIAGHMQCP